MSLLLPLILMNLQGHRVHFSTSLFLKIFFKTPYLKMQLLERLGVCVPIFFVLGWANLWDVSGIWMWSILRSGPVSVWEPSCNELGMSTTLSLVCQWWECVPTEPLHAPFHLKFHTEIQSVQDAKMHGDPNLQLKHSRPCHSRDLIRWRFNLLSNALLGVSPSTGTC